MQAPWGSAGVQARPKRGQSVGRPTPRSTSGQRQAGFSRLSGRSRGARRPASWEARSSRMTSPLPGMMPRPRHAPSAGANACSSSPAGSGVALRGHHPAVGVLHLGPPVGALAKEEQDHPQEVHRLEAGHHAGDAVLLGQRAVGVGADDRGHVSRAEEAADADVRRYGREGPHRRRHHFVVAEDREVGDAAGCRLEQGRRHRGGGGLEAHAQEDDSPLGFASGRWPGHPASSTPRVRPRRRPGPAPGSGWSRGPSGGRRSW